MNKKNIILTILSILLFVGAVECFVVAILYHKGPVEIQNINEVYISDLDDYTTIYFDNLDILGRYAFKTADEYTDSEGSYSDTTYYVYDDSHPMDENELDCQYYIVKFCDKSGTEYISSFSVSAIKNFSLSTDFPQTISVCAGVAPIRENRLVNSYDQELADLRENALAEISQETQIPQANVTLGYQQESIEQVQSDVRKDTISFKIILAVFGIVLTAVGVLLVFCIKKIRMHNNTNKI